MFNSKFVAINYCKIIKCLKCISFFLRMKIWFEQLLFHSSTVCLLELLLLPFHDLSPLLCFDLRDTYWENRATKDEKCSDLAETAVSSSWEEKNEEGGKGFYYNLSDPHLTTWQRKLTLSLYITWKTLFHSITSNITFETSDIKIINYSVLYI